MSATIEQKLDRIIELLETLVDQTVPATDQAMTRYFLYRRWRQEQREHGLPANDLPYTGSPVYSREPDSDQ